MVDPVPDFSTPEIPEVAPAIEDLRFVPDPILTEHCEEVDEEAFGTPQLRALGAVLRATSRAMEGYGLAAPQLGVTLRVATLTLEGGQTVLVNPVITPEPSAGTTTAEERCFSVPGLRWPVERHNRIAVTWRDVEGGEHVAVFEGWTARVVQHELDHLDGITVFGRIPNRTQKRRYLTRSKKLRRSGDASTKKRPRRKGTHR